MSDNSGQASGCGRTGRGDRRGVRGPRGAAARSVVILVDRREPGKETSYGNAGILSSGSILPLNQPSLWSALPNYVTNRHAALRWNPAWAMRNIDWLARFLANATPSRSRPRATALHGLIAPVETAPGMDRASGSGAAHPRDRLAEGVAQRLPSTRRSESRPFSPNMASTASCSTARPSRRSSRTSCPFVFPSFRRNRGSVSCTHRPLRRSPGAVVKAYAKMFVGSGGEIRQSEIRRSCPTARAGAWCSRTARFRRAMSWWRWDLVRGSVAASRLSRSPGFQSAATTGVQAEPGTFIASSDP